jgi:high-affinity nickel-transport protein
LSSLLSLLAVGFFLGVRHATDADHVVAIATIVTRERRLSAAAAIGVLWGVGHGLTVAVVGCAIILFGVVIPPRVGLAMEFAVGIMLVILGVFTLAAVARQAREALALHLLHGQDASAHGANAGGQAPHAHSAPNQEHGHSHVHTHGDYVHSHEHGHSHGGHGHAEHSTPQAWLDRHFGRLTLYQALRPVIVGVVHGLAGSAAVGLLALAAVRDPFWGLVYLFVFGLGTIIGMMLITLVIAAPFAMSAQRLPVISSSVRAFAGALSLVFGLFLMYQIGVAGGLFSDSP